VAQRLEQAAHAVLVLAGAEQDGDDADGGDVPLDVLVDLLLGRHRVLEQLLEQRVVEGGERFEKLLPRIRPVVRSLTVYVAKADRPLALDEKAQKLLAGEARGHLAALHERLSHVDPWTAETLEAEVRAYADEAGLKLGKVAQPLRAALTGQSTSPGIFDVLVALGRAESLARIADQAQEAAS